MERELFRIKLAILINIISYQLMGPAESRCLDHQLVGVRQYNQTRALFSVLLELDVDVDGKVSTRSAIHPLVNRSS